VDATPPLGAQATVIALAENKKLNYKILKLGLIF
jgi:hypothetical protein